MLRSSYEIRVVGSLGPAALEAFADLFVDVEPTTTVLSGTFDQADLHSLLDRVRALGLELVDVKQSPPSPDSEPSSDTVPSEATDPGREPDG
jgi:hypothetical protein